MCLIDSQPPRQAQRQRDGLDCQRSPGIVIAGDVVPSDCSFTLGEMKRLFLQVAHQVQDYDIQGPSLAAALILILILFILCVRRVQTRKV